MPIQKKKRQFNPWARIDPLEEGMETYSSILAWRIPWTEDPDGLQSMALQRVGPNHSDLACRVCLKLSICSASWKSSFGPAKPFPSPLWSWRGLGRPGSLRGDQLLPTGGSPGSGSPVGLPGCRYCGEYLILNISMLLHPPKSGEADKKPEM